MIGSPRIGQRGAALLTVLLLSALLASLAAVATRSVMSGARAAAVFLDSMRADELGRAAADTVAYQIERGGPAAKRGGSFAVHFAQGELEVDYRSESARVDVNKAPVALIAALLGAAGAEPSLRRAVAGRIDAFRSAAASHSSAGAEDRAPGGAADPNAASQGGPTVDTPSPDMPIQQTLEVVRAWGLPQSLAAQVLPALTVANGGSTVDPVLADQLVLAALLNDDARIDDYVRRRSNGFVDTESALALLPTSAKPFAGFADVPAVHVLARVTIARRLVRQYDLVLRPSEARGGPPAILSWQPLFAEP